ncbi:selenoprotein H [Cocos nucifera]|uniref:Selenoprotein H n=1 Tax=Cocos nucifera TaxID=13894 RepID=A0A8K0MZB0_COCNU|nr:selenoprotein H [Cocos nucifera]
MAPKRKERKNPAPAPTLSPRKTRSATAGKRIAPPPAPATSPAKKKAKLAAEKRKNEVSDGKKGKGSRLKGKGRVSSDEAPVAPPTAATAVADGASSKTIIVEACKQCNSFKTRANMVKEGLEKAVPSISVSVNPEKNSILVFIIQKGNQVNAFYFHPCSLLDPYYGPAFDFESIIYMN